jgi:hypothetical protein
MDRMRLIPIRDLSERHEIPIKVLRRPARGRPAWREATDRTPAVKVHS